MSDKNNFFPSIKGDKGLTVKKNSKQQLVLSFIGNKGPLSVTLNKENSNLFINYMIDIIDETDENLASEDPMKIVNGFLGFMKENRPSAPSEYARKEIDTKDHPFIHGNSGDVDKPLTGEDP